MRVLDASAEAPTTYAWDARGLLLRMTDPEGGQYCFGHDALGRRTTATYPNGMTLRTVHDAASRVVAMVYRNGAGAVIQSFTYTCDSRGNRTAKVFENGTAEVYGYDELSRLTRVTYPGGRQVKYEYDPVGNRTKMTEGTTGGGTADCANDMDCDGAPDASDNCPLVQNGSQADGDAPVYDQLLSAWKFEETEGLVAEDVTDTNPADLVGGVLRLAQGKHGRAVDLDGTSGYLKDAGQNYIAIFEGL